MITQLKELLRPWTRPPAEEPETTDSRRAHKLEVRRLHVSYGDKTVLRDVHLTLPGAGVTALIGPSGCGKSTLLMSLNRLLETIPGARLRGDVALDGVDIYGAGVKAQNVRRRIGLIFQKPNPFPLSVFQNVALALREHGVAPQARLGDRVEEALRWAGLWEEVRDRLDRPALSLSGGQQQRLCIARAVALHPEILLMDEPCSALDPVASARIEGLIRRLGDRFAVLVVTHNLPQARRVSSVTTLLYPEGGAGRVIETGPTADLFAKPIHPVTRDYVMGRVG